MEINWLEDGHASWLGCAQYCIYAWLFGVTWSWINANDE
jgi:hypothetical protein